MKSLNTQTGFAFIVTTGLLLLITLLGFATFRWSVDEAAMAGNQKASVQAQYIAEAGVDLILQWFQEPSAFPSIGTYPQGYSPGEGGNFLSKRRMDNQGAASFLDDKGNSQFIGTAEDPDFLFQSDSESPDFLVEGFLGIGALTVIKLYGPSTPGAVATLEATGTTSSGISRTVSVELLPSPIPPPTAAVQSGPESDGPVPFLVHWGDVRILGNGDLGGTLSSIPQKDPTAPVTGQPYSSSDRKDAWLDFYVGDSIVNPSVSCLECTEPFLSEGFGHLHQRQNEVHPDFGMDRWNYQKMKAFAKDRGVYFGSDREGFLYRDGNMDPAGRMMPSVALAGTGEQREFVFIDTVDQKPPDGSNFATLDLPIDYLEGIFSVQANLVLREAGPGRSVQVESPPVEGSNDASGRQSIILSSVHLKGVLSVAGHFAVEGRPNVFGALVANQGFGGTGQPEVWYDYDLRTGYYSGLPVVTILAGTWYMK